MTTTTTIKMQLTKPARKQGGDRYEGGYKGEDIVFYIPQVISRQDGTPADTLTVTISK